MIYLLLLLAFFTVIWTSYWLGVWTAESKQRVDLGRCDHGIPIMPQMHCADCEAEAVSTFLAEIWRNERTVQ